jgi:hypothetical protein
MWPTTGGQVAGAEPWSLWNGRYSITLSAQGIKGGQEAGRFNYLEKAQLGRGLAGVDQIGALLPCRHSPSVVA